MATSASILVPLEDYLNTTYRPDRDWIDGETKERNMGEMSHATVQAFFSYLFRLKAVSWKIRVLPEQRVQTSAKRYRIADLCVVRRETGFEPIVRTAPLTLHRNPLPRRPYERDSGARRRLSCHGR